LKLFFYQTYKTINIINFYNKTITSIMFKHSSKNFITHENIQKYMTLIKHLKYTYSYHCIYGIKPLSIMLGEKYNYNSINLYKYGIRHEVLHP